MPRRFFGRSEEDKVESKEVAQEQEGEELEHDELFEPDPELSEEKEEPEELSELELAQIEAAESKDKYIRLVAELENVKKRNAKERSEIIRYSGEHIVQDLLLVLDNFQRALAAQSESTTLEELFTGVQMIADEFVSALEKHGVVGVDAVGKPFDPKEHEALATIPTEDEAKGVVIEQLKKAYYMRDKLLRPAQVVVSAGMPEEESEPEAEFEVDEEETE